MDYIKHVQQAVDFIEADLVSDITFADAARAAGFSAFHFHRIFQGLVGESVTDYIRKRRLTLAAAELLSSGRRVVDIALDYRFGSDASFTRAFEQAYGLSPSRYRRLGKPLLLLEKPRLTPDRLRRLAQPAREPRRVALGSITVVGLGYLGSNERGEIPALWREFTGRIGEIRGRTGAQATLGVCEPVEQMTAESEISYLACVGVESGSAVPPGMVKRELAPQVYLVFTHRGPADDLEETYRYIYGTYFPHSGVERAEAPDFELYDSRFRPGAQESEMDIYIPLKRQDKGEACSQ